MSTTEILDDLQQRLQSGYPIIFLKSWEEERWQAELTNLCSEIDRRLVIWTAADGPQPRPAGDAGEWTDPLEFINAVDRYGPGHVVLLKDFHPYWADPRIVRRLRSLATALPKRQQSLLLLSPVGTLPVELQKDAVTIELPKPGMDELRLELATVVGLERSRTGRTLSLSQDEQERLLMALLGLTAGEARKALTRALRSRERIDEDVFATLVAEKKQMVEGSDLLEFHDLSDGIDDVGGLDVLKRWLAQRAKAFGARAREQGIPHPQGVLLLGVQGCGKSLTARAAARLLSFPLVRLDVANLLSPVRGTSERNLRDVLALVESIAPAVLWLDEIEKGFAGTDPNSAKDLTITRLLGSFLAWMEEHTSPVFVVATANSVNNLPPEMLRRGRFDEMFFINLPSFQERVEIFRIHLKKRGWKPGKYDLDELAGRTEDYSGAEIEQIVVSAMIQAFSREDVLSQDDLEQACGSAVPLAVTMEENVFQLREWARDRCRPATSDTRVMQMLDAERGKDPIYQADDERDSQEEQRWIKLAEHGQWKAAVVEYVHRRSSAIFPQLQDDFADFMETSGEAGLALRSDPNAVLWVGFSRELADVLAGLISSRRLYVHPASLKRYTEHGDVLKLPQIDELPEERLARPCWLPASLRHMPQESGTGRFARVVRIKLSRSHSARSS